MICLPLFSLVSRVSDLLFKGSNPTEAAAFRRDIWYYTKGLV